MKHSGGGSGEAEAGASAAAPDYETLKRETEMLELRVHEFYRGVCEEVQTQAVEVETHCEVSKHNANLQHL